MQKKKGVSLIVLVITIIIILILAGTIILTLGENNIIDYASKAKLANDIRVEKEIINLAVLDVYKNTTEATLNTAIASYSEGRDVEVVDVGDGIEILFKDVNRCYEIDSNKNITGPKEVLKDNTPGDITKDKDGKVLQGTADEPYEIWSIEDLVALSAAVNGGYTNGDLKISETTYSGMTIKLMTDLNFKSKMSYTDAETNVYNNYLGIENETVTLIQGLTDTQNYQGFIPIGNNLNGLKKFQGTFDGNNKTIKNICENLTIYAGLFGNVYNATIKDLTVTGKIQTTDVNAGGIVATIHGGTDVFTTITNCKNYIDVVGAAGEVGGIVGSGYTKYLIENCENYGNVYSTGNAGGIVGFMRSIGDNDITYVNKCVNVGKITGTNAGGIAGEGSYYTSVINSYNGKEAEIISVTGYAGGIAGDGTCCKLINCYNLGSVFGDRAGGISGYVYRWAGAKILNCFTTSQIQGTSIRGAIAAYGEVEAENNFYIQTDTITAVGQGKVQNSTGITVLDSSTIEALNKYITDNETEADEIKLLKWGLDSEGNPMFINE